MIYFLQVSLNTTSEAFDSARDEYITGYDDEDRRVFPTLALVAKELKFPCPLFVRRQPMKDGIRKEKIFSNHAKNLTSAKILKVSIPN